MPHLSSSGGDDRWGGSATYPVRGSVALYPYPSAAWASPTFSDGSYAEDKIRH